MSSPYLVPVTLGVLLFSFLICSILVVPFIDLLYKLHFVRQKEAPKKGKIPLFDKLHDKKAGTPVGGGILLIPLVTLLFFLLFPLISYAGVYIQTAYFKNAELFIIFFTFISFGLLGALDDLVKMFGKSTKGNLGRVFGLRKKQKFVIQWILGFLIGYLIYKNLGVQIVHVPMLKETFSIGAWYIPFAAFVVVTFANALNITDGLDGLAAGLLVTCLVVFAVIAAGNIDTPLSIFISLWIGVLLAFLYFNIWPARIFLGDAGALSFGATLAVVALLTGNVIALFVVGGIFMVEVASSAVQIIGWKTLKRPILPIAPLHHAFLAIGWEEPKIVMRAWLAGIVLAIFALWLAAI